MNNYIFINVNLLFQNVKLKLKLDFFKVGANFENV